MNIILFIICLGTISFLSMSCLIILCVKYNYYTDIMLFFSDNDRNVVPMRNIHNITVKPKKEIELTPMKKYVVIQSPDQQFSIGIEVEPLNI